MAAASGGGKKPPTGKPTAKTPAGGKRAAAKAHATSTSPGAGKRAATKAVAGKPKTPARAIGKRQAGKPSTSSLPASPIIDYYTKLKNGEAIAGQYIHAVYEIIVEGLQRGEYIYDSKKANKAIKFIEGFCRHSEGREDLITLELWQKAIVACIFGIVDTDGLRVWREVFVVVARKNGKSLFAAAIIAVMAYLYGEYGSKIFCLATKLDQAKQVFDGFHQMIVENRKHPEREMLSVRTKKRIADIYIQETNTVIKPISFSHKKTDGLNPELVVCDELHAWEGNRGLKLYEVMKSALGARRQPFILSISTAGYENDGIYDSLIRRATAFLNRDSRERRLLPFLYMIDDVDKWNDLEEIKKANPNIGVSVFEHYYEDERAIAETDLSKRREFLMKYCNVKQAADIAWLDNRLLEGAVVPLTLDDFRGANGRGTYAVGGVDLSQSVDLTAASVIIEKEGKLYAFCQFFMPNGRIEAAIIEDNVPYDLYVQQGVLALSGENRVNYRDVYDWFVWVQSEYKIYLLKIGYDRYMAHYLVDDLKNYGFHMDDVIQADNLTPVIREFQGTIKDGDFFIANNHLLKSHFLNVALKHNLEKRTFRPVKIEQRKRIDGFVAVIDALTVRHKYLGEVGEMLKNKGR